MNKNILIAIAVFLVVVVLGAFTIKKPVINNSTPHPQASSSGNSQEIEIVATEYSLTPNLITVQRGNSVTITYRNAGTTTHTLFVEGYNVQTGGVAPGKSATLSFIAGQTGTFSFYCNIDSHRELGMQGSLEVK